MHVWPAAGSFSPCLLCASPRVVFSCSAMAATEASIPRASRRPSSPFLRVTGCAPRARPGKSLVSTQTTRRGPAKTLCHVADSKPCHVQINADAAAATSKLPAMRSNACKRFRLRVTPGIHAGACLLYYVNVYCLDRWESCYIRVALSVGVEYE